MKVSSEFIKAVQERKILIIKIMLKDSLLLDKTFKLFNEMEQYALNHGIDIYNENGMLKKEPEYKWNLQLMNFELTLLVNNFTRERIEYCKQIITKVSENENLAIKVEQDNYEEIVEEIRILSEKFKYRVKNKDIDEIIQKVKKIFILCCKVKYKKYIIIIESSLNKIMEFINKEE